MYGPWTLDEKRIMVETYRRMHLARCPSDHALLTVIDVRTGQTPREGEQSVLLLRCPTCLRNCFSYEIERFKGHPPR